MFYAHCAGYNIAMSATVTFLLSCVALLAGSCDARTMQLVMVNDAVNEVRFHSVSSGQFASYVYTREPCVWTDHHRVTTSEGAAGAVRTSGSCTRRAEACQ